MSILSCKVRESMTLLSLIVNLIESGPCHLYVNTPTLTLPSTRRQEPCPPSETPVWYHDGGRCLCWSGTQQAKVYVGKHCNVKCKLFIEILYLSDIIGGHCAYRAIYAGGQRVLCYHFLSMLVYIRDRHQYKSENRAPNLCTLLQKANLAGQNYFITFSTCTKHFWIP